MIKIENLVEIDLTYSVEIEYSCQLDNLVEIGLTYSAISAANTHWFLIGIQSQLSYSKLTMHILV